MKGFDGTKPPEPGQDFGRGRFGRWASWGFLDNTRMPKNDEIPFGYD